MNSLDGKLCPQDHLSYNFHTTAGMFQCNCSAVAAAGFLTTPCSAPLLPTYARLSPVALCQPAGACHVSGQELQSSIPATSLVQSLTRRRPSSGVSAAVR